jgi:hypothetical protein
VSLFPGSLKSLASLLQHRGFLSATVTPLTGLSGLLHHCNTRYEWLVRPCSTGSFTLQETPSFAWRTNGLAQRQRRDLRDSFSIMHYFWQIAPVFERQSRCPLQPVLGGELLHLDDSRLDESKETVNLHHLLSKHLPALPLRSSEWCLLNLSPSHLR